MCWTSTTAGLAFAALLVSAAQAAAMPADCSKANVPDGPVKGAVQGKPFVPTQAQLRSAGTMSQDHTVFDTYRLTFKRPEGDMRAATADVTFLVPKGKRPDGRTFRQVPGGISDQPMASEGLPEVQGWSFNDDVTLAHISSVFAEKSSLKVHFAKRMGTKIAGTVYLCAPGDKPFWLGGHFTAEVKN